jgi:hypothetical protein
MEADDSWETLAKFLIVAVLLFGVGAFMRGYVIEEEKQTKMRESVCEKAGMELVYSSVSHGKYSKTFYMCRDKDGVIHALPEGEK